MTLAVRSPRRSRIAHFKTPFVVAVLAPVAPFGIGCGARAEELAGPPLASGGATQTSSTTAAGSTSNPATTNPTATLNGPTSCPAERPILGSACSATAATGVAGSAGGGCQYEPLPVCVTGIACINGTWRYSGSGGCNPPWAFGFNICPDTEPAVGTSCASAKPGVTCEYAYCYGTAPLVRCSEQSVLWEPLPVPSCNPPPMPEVTCPEQMPTHGADCAHEAQVCAYDGCQGAGTDTATCSYGQWLVRYIPGPACNPPAALTPICPLLEPVTGNGCAFEGQECRYGSCGSVETSSRTATCSSGTWQLQEVPCFGSSDAGVDGGG
jgi:hypothetical protein